MLRFASTHRPGLLIGAVLALAALLPTLATAQCANLMDFETRTPGEIWALPGQFMFYEDGIPAYTHIFDTGSGTTFGAAEITVPGIADFGSGNAMTFENACNRYVIGALGLAVDQVRFECVHFGQFVNIGANGYSVRVAQLSWLNGMELAPGINVAATVTTLPGGGEHAEVTVMGNVRGLIFGADTGSIDNICVVGHDVPSQPCHFEADHESQPPGTAWGGPPHTDSPGDLVFTENDVDVYVRFFYGGGLPSFGEAIIDDAILPTCEHRHMNLEDISVRYRADTFAVIRQVTFNFFEWDGAATLETLEIGGLRYVGQLSDLPANYFPGVNATVSRVFSPPYVWGLVRLEGIVRDFTVGGQQLVVDNVCFVRDLTLSVENEDTPAASRIDEIKPNPFNPRTEISYRVQETGHVKLTVVDLTGRVVRTLVDETQVAANRHTVVWDGRDGSGRVVSAGLYLVTLQSGGATSSRKVALIK